jgi:shikimate dehydrogenase
MKRAGVIGWPIAHSRSPLIHNHWLKQHGIAGTYEALAVPPEGLEQFMQYLRQSELAGCNVTMPHKEQVGHYLDIVAAQARDAGSINTIYRHDNQLIGTSTDAEGFIANVQSRVPAFQWERAQVLVLGAGGSARAIIAGMLTKQVAQVFVWNRSSERAEILAQTFGARVRAIEFGSFSAISRQLGLLVNTIPQGAENSPTADFDFRSLNSAAVVADIVYVPLITPFLAQAKALGFQIVPGLGMLLHQAVGGFEKWFGLRPNVTEELYRLVAADIEREHAR